MFAATAASRTTASAEMPGLYENIWKKRRRIAAGSGESMRKPGTKGAPTAQDFRKAAKTAKGKRGKP